MQNQLKLIIKQAIGNIYQISFHSDDIQIERPQDKNHGDFSTNTALVLSGKLKKEANEIAQKLAIEINKLLETNEQIKDFVQRIDTKSPGFINFKLKHTYYYQNLLQINTNYGKKDLANSQKVIVEMGDPNTHKIPHIGHLFNYIIGEYISKLYEFFGANIYRVSWEGDVGPHVAKCIFGWRQLKKPEPETIIEKMNILQKSYVYGSQLYDQNSEYKQIIDQLNKQIYKKDPAILNDWEKTKKWSLNFQKQFEKKLNIKLDNKYLEGDLWKQGLEIVKKNINKIFQKSQGAIVFKGEKWGLHTRVFLTKEGTPTYETKEVGLAIQKQKDFPFDLTIIPTANEQNEYFKVVFKAIELMIPSLKNKLKHIGTGMINLKGGKISSRKGNVITGPQLISIVEKEIKKRVKNRKKINEKEQKQIVNKVSLASVKYAFLKSNILQNMVFDLDESISFEGNSGPYILYTYARIQSVLKKYEISNSNNQKNILNKLKTLKETSEIEILQTLEKFPDVLENSFYSIAPHLIATYIFELSKLYNAFYKKFQINNAPNNNLIFARRFLSQKVAIVLKIGLNILGIETVDQM